MQHGAEVLAVSLVLVSIFLAVWQFGRLTQFVPRAGNSAQKFNFDATGFNPRERVKAFVRLSDGREVQLRGETTNFDGAVKISATSDASWPAGSIKIIVKGESSGKEKETSFVYGQNLATSQQNSGGRESLSPSACRSAGGQVGPVGVEKWRANANESGGGHCDSVSCGSACCFTSCQCSGTCGAEQVYYQPPSQEGSSGPTLQGSPDCQKTAPDSPACAGDKAWGECVTRTGTNVEQCTNEASNAYLTRLGEVKKEAQKSENPALALAQIERQTQFDNTETYLRRAASCKDGAGKPLSDKSQCLDPSGKQVELPSNPKDLEKIVGEIYKDGKGCQQDSKDFAKCVAESGNKALNPSANISSSGTPASNSKPVTAADTAQVLKASCKPNDKGYVSNSVGQCYDCGKNVLTTCALAAQTVAAAACGQLANTVSYGVCLQLKSADFLAGKPVTQELVSASGGKSVCASSTEYYVVSSNGNKGAKQSCTSGQSCSLGDCVSASEAKRRAEQLSNMDQAAKGIAGSKAYEDFITQRTEAVRQGFDVNSGNGEVQLSQAAISDQCKGGGKYFRTQGNNQYYFCDGERRATAIEESQLKKQEAEQNTVLSYCGRNQTDAGVVNCYSQAKQLIDKGGKFDAKTGIVTVKTSTGKEVKTGLYVLNPEIIKTSESCGDGYKGYAFVNGKYYSCKDGERPSVAKEEQIKKSIANATTYCGSDANPVNCFSARAGAVLTKDWNVNSQGQLVDSKNGVWTVEKDKYVYQGQGSPSRAAGFSGEGTPEITFQTRVTGGTGQPETSPSQNVIAVPAKTFSGGGGRAVGFPIPISTNVPVSTTDVPPGSFPDWLLQLSGVRALADRLKSVNGPVVDNKSSTGELGVEGTAGPGNSADAAVRMAGLLLGDLPNQTEEQAKARQIQRQELAQSLYDAGFTTEASYRQLVQDGYIKKNETTIALVNGVSIQVSKGNNPDRMSIQTYDFMPDMSINSGGDMPDYLKVLYNRANPADNRMPLTLNTNNKDAVTAFYDSVGMNWSSVLQVGLTGKGFDGKPFLVPDPITKDTPVVGQQLTSGGFNLGPVNITPAGAINFIAALPGTVVQQFASAAVKVGYMFPDQRNINIYVNEHLPEGCFNSYGGDRYNRMARNANSPECNEEVDRIGLEAEKLRATSDPYIQQLIYRDALSSTAVKVTDPKTGEEIEVPLSQLEGTQAFLDNYDAAAVASKVNQNKSPAQGALDAVFFVTMIGGAGGGGSKLAAVGREGISKAFSAAGAEVARNAATGAITNFGTKAGAGIIPRVASGVGNGFLWAMDKPVLGYVAGIPQRTLQATEFAVPFTAASFGNEFSEAQKLCDQFNCDDPDNQSPEALSARNFKSGVPGRTAENALTLVAAQVFYGPLVHAFASGSVNAAKAVANGSINLARAVNSAVNNPTPDISNPTKGAYYDVNPAQRVKNLQQDGLSLNEALKKINQEAKDSGKAVLDNIAKSPEGGTLRVKNADGKIETWEVVGGVGYEIGPSGVRTGKTAVGDTLSGMASRSISEPGVVSSGKIVVDGEVVPQSVRTSNEPSVVTQAGDQTVAANIANQIRTAAQKMAGTFTSRPASAPVVRETGGIIIKDSTGKEVVLKSGDVAEVSYTNYRERGNPEGGGPIRPFDTAQDLQRAIDEGVQYLNDSKNAKNTANESNPVVRSEIRIVVDGKEILYDPFTPNEKPQIINSNNKPVNAVTVENVESTRTFPGEIPQAIVIAARNIWDGAAQRINLNGQEKMVGGPYEVDGKDLSSGVRRQTGSNYGARANYTTTVNGQDAFVKVYPKSSGRAGFEVDNLKQGRNLPGGDILVEPIGTYDSKDGASQIAVVKNYPNSMNLKQFLDGGGVIPVDLIANAQRQWVKLHDAGYQHGDVKTENTLVILDSKGKPAEIKVIDPAFVDERVAAYALKLEYDALWTQFRVSPTKISEIPTEYSRADLSLPNNNLKIDPGDIVVAPNANGILEGYQLPKNDSVLTVNVDGKNYVVGTKGVEVPVGVGSKILFGDADPISNKFFPEVSFGQKGYNPENPIPYSLAEIQLYKPTLQSQSAPSNKVKGPAIPSALKNTNNVITAAIITGLAVTSPWTVPPVVDFVQSVVIPPAIEIPVAPGPKASDLITGISESVPVLPKAKVENNFTESVPLSLGGTVKPPVNGPTEISGYKYRELTAAETAGGAPLYHNGVDLRTGNGDGNLRSPIDGKVVEFGNKDPYFGVYTMLQGSGKNSNLWILLGHSKAIPGTTNGKIVKANEIVANPGTNGEIGRNSTGEHLDMRVIVSPLKPNVSDFYDTTLSRTNKTVDPCSILEIDCSGFTEYYSDSAPSVYTPRDKLMLEAVSKWYPTAELNTGSFNLPFYVDFANHVFGTNYSVSDTLAKMWVESRFNPNPPRSSDSNGRGLMQLTREAWESDWKRMLFQLQRVPGPYANQILQEMTNDSTMTLAKAQDINPADYINQPEFNYALGAFDQSARLYDLKTQYADIFSGLSPEMQKDLALAHWNGGFIPFEAMKSYLKQNGDRPKSEIEFEDIVPFMDAAKGKRYIVGGEEKVVDDQKIQGVIIFTTLAKGQTELMEFLPEYAYSRDGLNLNDAYITYPGDSKVVFASTQNLGSGESGKQKVASVLDGERGVEAGDVATAPVGVIAVAGNSLSNEVNSISNGIQHGLEQLPGINLIRGTYQFTPVDFKDGALKITKSGIYEQGFSTTIGKIIIAADDVQLNFKPGQVVSGNIEVRGNNVTINGSGTQVIVPKGEYGVAVNGANNVKVNGLVVTTQPSKFDVPSDNGVIWFDRLNRGGVADGGIRVSDARNVSIEDVTISGSSDLSAGAFGVDFQNCIACSLSRSFVTGTVDGVRVNKGKNVTLSYNSFEGHMRTGKAPGGEDCFGCEAGAIVIVNTDGVLVTNNNIANSGNGVYVLHVPDTLTSSSRRIRVENNTFQGITNNAIEQVGTKNITVTDNTFVGDNNPKQHGVWGTGSDVYINSGNSFTGYSKENQIVVDDPNAGLKGQVLPLETGFLGGVWQGIKNLSTSLQLQTVKIVPVVNAILNSPSAPLFVPTVLNTAFSPFLPPMMGVVNPIVPSDSNVSQGDFTDELGDQETPINAFLPRDLTKQESLEIDLKKFPENQQAEDNAREIARQKNDWQLVDAIYYEPSRSFIRFVDGEQGVIDLAVKEINPENIVLGGYIFNPGKGKETVDKYLEIVQAATNGLNKTVRHRVMTVNNASRGLFLDKGYELEEGDVITYYKNYEPKTDKTKDDDLTKKTQELIELKEEEGLKTQRDLSQNGVSDNSQALVPFAPQQVQVAMEEFGIHSPQQNQSLTPWGKVIYIFTPDWNALQPVFPEWRFGWRLFQLGAGEAEGYVHQNYRQVYDDVFNNPFYTQIRNRVGPIPIVPRIFPPEPGPVPVVKIPDNEVNSLIPPIEPWIDQQDPGIIPQVQDGKSVLVPGGPGFGPLYAFKVGPFGKNTSQKVIKNTVDSYVKYFKLYPEDGFILRYKDGNLVGYVRSNPNHTMKQIVKSMNAPMIKAGKTAGLSMLISGIPEDQLLITPALLKNPNQIELPENISWLVKNSVPKTKFGDVFLIQPRRISGQGVVWPDLGLAFQEKGLFKVSSDKVPKGFVPEIETWRIIP